MATGEQLKALIESFGDKDRDRFYRIALQLAAQQARRGHTNVARELRDAIEEARKKTDLFGAEPGPVPITRPRRELEGVLSASFPDTRLPAMVLPARLRRQLERLVREQRERHVLREHGLEPRRKLLLVGPPGTGKTMTARALAGTLHKPLFVVRLDALMSRYMGATASKLRLVFEAMAEQEGVYLFDEFDAIGAERARGDDIGEVRRVLNSFLQFIEQDETNSLIIAATNHPGMLDHALFRRFDDVIEYDLPDEQQRLGVLQSYLTSFDATGVAWDEVANAANGLSHADIERACQDAAKDMLLDGRTTIRTFDLVQAIEDRRPRTKFSDSVEGAQPECGRAGSLALS